MIGHQFYYGLLRKYTEILTGLSSGILSGLYFGILSSKLSSCIYSDIGILSTTNSDIFPALLLAYFQNFWHSSVILQVSTVSFPAFCLVFF